MKKNWELRDWDKTNPEKRFEQLLKDNDFEIKGVKLWQSKVDYLIAKDDVELEWAIHGVDNKTSRGDENFNQFKKYYDLYMQVKVKKEAN